MRSAALSKAYLHPEMVVAAVDIGVEMLSMDLAPAVKQVHWFGSPLFVLENQGKLSEFNNIAFHITERLYLPLEDSSVDGIFANLDAFQLPDLLPEIREYMRVLRPGGRVVLIRNHPTLPGPNREIKQVPEVDPEQVRYMLQAAGLVNIIVECGDQAGLFNSTATADRRGNERLVVAVGTRRVTARQQVQDSYGARAQESNNCCGDDSCCAPSVVALDNIGTVHWEAGYSPTELAEIPGDAAEFSLGCGNPLAIANLRPGEIVLDIGSGGGIDVFLAARQVGEHGFVFGVDMTEAMLERARKTAQQNGITNVEFRAGYAEALPLESESVDVVISNCVINLSEDKGRVFHEAYRVIKPGGRLEINDTVFEAGVLPAIRASASGWAACISGALPQGEYLDLIRQAGFRDIRVQRSTSSGTSAGVSFYSIQVSAKK